MSSLPSDKQLMPAYVVGLSLTLAVALVVIVLSCCFVHSQRELADGVVAAVWQELDDQRLPQVMLCARVDSLGVSRDFCGLEGSSGAVLHDLGLGSRVQVVLVRPDVGRPYIESVRYGRGDV